MLLQALLDSRNGSSVTFNPPPFRPTTSSVLINGLWFCSLLLSVASALGGSLAKGWLAEFTQVRHKPSAEAAYIRHRRHNAISRWRLLEIISILPTLLHLALLLFSYGLILLLLRDNKPIGYMIFTLSLAVTVTYSSTIFAPSLDRDCPFRSPLRPYTGKFVDLLFSNDGAGREDLTMAYKRDMIPWLHSLWSGSPIKLTKEFGDSHKEVRLTVVNGITELCGDGITFYVLNFKLSPMSRCLSI